MITISGMGIICPECGSDDVEGKCNTNSAKIQCNDCGHEGTARRGDGR
jgi:predicted RNA-binding Zn-ribbon protein involved in translation (DUF1610 family)